MALLKKTGMCQIRMEYKFLVFMYAYLRQVDLSIDRSRWDSWVNLKSYFKIHINPLKVLDQLSKKTGVKYEGVPLVYFISKPSSFVKMKEFFLRAVIKKQYMSEIQVLYCCQLLRQFDFLLNQDFDNYPLEAEKLRNDVSDFYTSILEPKIWFKDLNIAMKVEHFMQSENLEIVAITAFVY